MAAFQETKIWVTRLSFLSVFILLAGQSAAADAPSPADAAAAASAVNQFGLDLFARLATPDANLCLAPYSLECCLSMLYEGADGDTHTEMAAALHLPAENRANHASFSALGHTLADSIAAASSLSKHFGISGAPITLELGNRLFAQKGFPFEQAYLDLLSQFYHAPLTPVDFSGQPEAATRQINAWAAQATHQQSQSILPPQGFPGETSLVLGSTFYFQAMWGQPFDPRLTKSGTFRIRGEEWHPTMMMTQNPMIFRFRAYDEFKAIGIPYFQGEFQLLILLPNSSTGLPALEHNLSADRLAEFSKAPPGSGRLTMPRFKFSAAASLNGPLKALGLKTVFDDPKGSADFSKIAPRNAAAHLALADVLHGTTLSVDEVGTEASAVSRGSAVLDEPLDLRIDHPFFFAVQHVPSGACLMLGHVVDPRPPQQSVH